MPFFLHIISRMSTLEIVKDKNYKKAKMKGGLCWMKKYRGNDPRSLFNGNHFSSSASEAKLTNRRDSLKFKKYISMSTKSKTY